VTANRLVTIYSRALAIGGLVALARPLIVDPRWTGQPVEVLGLLVAALLLREGRYAEQVFLSHPDRIWCAGGSLVVGAPATALALAGGVLGADWFVAKEDVPRGAGERGARGDRAARGLRRLRRRPRLSNVTAPGLHVELVPALFFSASRISSSAGCCSTSRWSIRGKLEQDERLLILRYECIGYGATVIATGSSWHRELLAAARVGVRGGGPRRPGLLFKHTLEEAIAAEELNKIHAMEAVITSISVSRTRSLESSGSRIAWWTGVTFASTAAGGHAPPRLPRAHRRAERGEPTRIRPWCASTSRGPARRSSSTT